jgi:DNA-binding transcriptional MerR regulator
MKYIIISTLLLLALATQSKAQTTAISYKKYQQDSIAWVTQIKSLNDRLAAIENRKTILKNTLKLTRPGKGVADTLEVMPAAVGIDKLQAAAALTSETQAKMLEQLKELQLAGYNMTEGLKLNGTAILELQEKIKRIPTTATSTSTTTTTTILQ